MPVYCPGTRAALILSLASPGVITRSTSLPLFAWAFVTTLTGSVPTPLPPKEYS